MLPALNTQFLGGPVAVLGRRRGGARQKLGGLPIVVTGTGSGSYTARRAVRVLIYAWGGGQGGSSGGLGGFAAGAFYHELIMKPGQVLSYVSGAGGTADNTGGVPGADGVDSTVTLPNGLVLTAFAGKSTGLGGGAQNATINRPAVKPASGVTPGDAGGFADHASDLAGGLGGIPGVIPGGGGGASGVGHGASGRVIIIPFRLS